MNQAEIDRIFSIYDEVMAMGWLKERTPRHIRLNMVVHERILRQAREETQKLVEYGQSVGIKFYPYQLVFIHNYFYTTLRDEVTC